MSSIERMIRKSFNTIGLDLKRLKKIDPNLKQYYALYPEDSVKNHRFYNVGAGLFRHPAWTNIDHFSEWYKGNITDIDYDLESLKPFPIPDNSAEVVYSSHTVEHISNAAAQNLFNEAYRVLKPGGYLRVTTPNIDLESRAYLHNDRDYFYWIERYSQTPEIERINIDRPMSEASIQQIFLSHFASSACLLHKDGAKERITDEELDRVFREMPYEQALDYCISKCDPEVQKKYPGNHINWWNHDKMSRMFQQAGFEKIYRSGYGQSFCPVLRHTDYFDNTHPKISLYVETIK